MFIDKLNEYKNSAKFISVYSLDNNSDAHCFDYGKIMAINDKMIVFYDINPDGSFDGLITLSIDEIYRIDIDCAYDSKMKFLMKNKKDLTSELSISDDNSIIDMLMISKKKEYVIALQCYEDNNMNLNGIVTDIYDDYVVLKNIDDYGNADGETLILINKIIEIRLYGKFEQGITELYKSKNSK